MNLIRKLAVVVVALGSVSVAQAGLIPLDNDVFGAGSITRDTESGLEWLDVTETMGLSFNYVSGQFAVGGEFEGWRYASMIEVASLWDAAGGNDLFYFTGWNAANDRLTQAIGALIGFTRIDSDTLGSREIFALMADSSEVGRHQASLLWDNEGLPGNVGLDYTNLAWASILDTTSDTPLASWLVRETTAVPEPGTLALFAIGLAGIGLARRRNQSA